MVYIKTILLPKYQVNTLRVCHCFSHVYFFMFSPMELLLLFVESYSMAQRTSGNVWLQYPQNIFYKLHVQLFQMQVSVLQVSQVWRCVQRGLWRISMPFIKQIKLLLFNGKLKGLMQNFMSHFNRLQIMMKNFSIWQIFDDNDNKPFITSYCLAGL